MKSNTAEYQEWQAACSAERAAWLCVQATRVGDPLDAQAWERWLRSLDRETVALQALLEAQAQVAPSRRRSKRGSVNTNVEAIAHLL